VRPVLFSKLSIACAATLTCPVYAADNYSVVMNNAPDGLQPKLDLISSLSAERHAYPTNAALRRAGNEDITLLENALKAAGFYNAQVNFSLEKSKSTQKAIAQFNIEPGPLFKISRHKIIFTDSGDGNRPRDFQDLNLDISTDADGASLQKNQQKFHQALLENGFPTAKMGRRFARIDEDDGFAIVTYEFNSGPRATFGKAHIQGQQKTKISFLEKLKTWEEGAKFDQEKLIAYRDKLSSTGLFQSIDVQSGLPAQNGAAPVLVDVTERKRRTIGTGLSFSTSEGPGGRLFFEYRNLLGAGETARIDIEATQLAQQISFNFNKPMPNFPGSTFASFQFTNETTDAFDARTVQLSGGVSKRWLDDRLETRGGVALETSKVETATSETRNYFFSLPLTAIWDTETDPIALNSGARASLNITPFTGSDTFTRADFNARSRLNFGPANRFTLAGRMRLGALIGTPLNDLPANERFFSGGGASVRGYDFQSVGTLDTQGNPIGGRSLVEAAIEARAKITQTIQIAAFADTGSVSSGAFPRFNGDYFTGIGGGIRYFTPIGPLRLDVAIPLEQRPTDRAIQFFISLGQPF